MRVKGSTHTRNRRKRVLKQAKGYFGSKHLYTEQPMNK